MQRAQPFGASLERSVVTFGIAFPIDIRSHPGEYVTVCYKNPQRHCFDSPRLLDFQKKLIRADRARA